MRVALMAMGDEGEPPVRLAGRPVAWHQLQAMLGLGCERVVCLADAPSPVLAALQRETEGRGAKFHAVPHHRALSGLVSAADTLFVVAPGILPDREWLTQMLGARAGVAVLPAAGAVERGFERIDRERAWGGILATRGDSVEALSALPPDADVVAGLLRITLQRGARCVEVPQHWLDEGRWALLRDSAIARRLEEGWHSRHVPAPGLDLPGEAFAHRLARALLSRAADYPALPTALSIGGIAVAILGGVVGFLGYTFAGLSLLTLGTMVAQTGGRLRLLARAGAGEPRPGRFVEVRDAVLDLALIVIAASPREFAGWSTPFVAAVLVAAMRLASEDSVARAARPFGDRLLVAALLTGGAAAGTFPSVAAVLALVALAVRLFGPRRRG